MSSRWAAAGPGWAFWIRYVEAARAGQYLDPALLEEIATQDNAFWQGPDDEVNARIAAIVARHEQQDPVEAEVSNSLQNQSPPGKETVSRVQASMHAHRASLRARRLNLRAASRA